MRSRLSLHGLFFLSCLASCHVFARKTRAQQRQTSHPLRQRDDVHPPIRDDDDARARIAREMEKKAAKERVAALKTDTDKLLKLSVELKSPMSTNPTKTSFRWM